MLIVDKQLVYLESLELSIAGGNQELAISRYMQQTKDLCTFEGKQTFKIFRWPSLKFNLLLSTYLL